MPFFEIVSFLMTLVTVALVLRFVVCFEDRRTFWVRWLVMLAMLVPLHFNSNYLLWLLTWKWWEGWHLAGLRAPVLVGIWNGLFLGWLHGGVGRLIWSWQRGSLPGSAIGAVVTGLPGFYGVATLLNWIGAPTLLGAAFEPVFYTLLASCGAVGAIVGGMVPALLAHRVAVANS